MIKPVYYLQGDSKWRNHNYSAKGESKTIASSGCGPTSAAMIIETLRPGLEGEITPVETAEWSMKHGYKYLNQGTAYGYFVPQFKAYGIYADMLNTENHYNTTDKDLENEVEDLLKNPGHFVICCMGPGNWTRGGHYVVAYHIDDRGYVYINDPASAGTGYEGVSRIKASWGTFKRQVKYFWSVSWGIKYSIRGFENKIYKLYSKHDSTSKKLETVHGGDKVWLIRDLKDGWSLVATENHVGYLKNVAINAVGLTGYRRVTIDKDIKVHEKNSAMSSVIATVTAGNDVKIITKRKKWTNVVMPNGKNGWIKTSIINSCIN